MDQIALPMTFMTPVRAWVMAGMHACITAYHTVMPRLYGAWVGFCYPEIEMMNDTVGLLRTTLDGKLYGVYVAVDANLLRCSAGSDIFLRYGASDDDATVMLSPPPLPGLRLRCLTARDFRAEAATLVDSVFEETTVVAADDPLL